MFWRIISALGVLFWAVMTGLLIRDTYFPEESRFAEVPPKFVFDLFLKQRESATTLLLFRNQDRIGHSTFSIRRQNAVKDEPGIYDLQGSGLVEGKAFGSNAPDFAWRMSSELDEGQSWRSVIFQSGWRQENRSDPSRDGVTATISWKQGGDTPVFEVRQAGQVIMDNSKADALLKGGMMPLGGLLGSQANRSAVFANLAQVKAREGAMTLAGKRRKCYVLQMLFAGLYEIKMLFTEAGELARVELPQGLHLLEPTIHGLGAQLAP